MQETFEGAVASFFNQNRVLIPQPAVEIPVVEPAVPALVPALVLAPVPAVVHPPVAIPFVFAAAVPVIPAAIPIPIYVPVPPAVRVPAAVPWVEEIHLTLDPDIPRARARIPNSLRSDHKSICLSSFREADQKNKPSEMRTLGLGLKW